MATFYRREVLKSTFVLLWRKKYLWFLGFFVGVFYILIRQWTPPYLSLGDELDVVYNSLIGDANPISGFQAYLNAIRETVTSGDLSTFLKSLQTFFVNNVATSIGLILVALAIFFLVLWLSTIAQGAIVYTALRFQAQKASSFIDAIAAGSGRFRRILTAIVISGLFSVAVWIILVGLPAIFFFLTGNDAWRTVTILGSLLITLPLSLTISFLTKFIIVSTVQEDVDFFQSLRRAWVVFRMNWLVSLEFAVILFMINLVMVYVVVSMVVFMIFPSGWSEFWAITTILFVLIGFLRAFNLSAWTIVYQKLLEGKRDSTVGAWTSRLTDFLEVKKSPGV